MTDLDQCPHLFVYGTLRVGSNHPKHEQLMQAANHVGSGHLPGLLYRVSWYPGLVETDQPGAAVLGDVFLLHDAKALDWLDEFEGYSKSELAGCEYRRVIREVMLESGAKLPCWVYIYQFDVARLVRIESGDFLKSLRDG